MNAKRHNEHLSGYLKSHRSPNAKNAGSYPTEGRVGSRIKNGDEKPLSPITGKDSKNVAKTKVTCQKKSSCNGPGKTAQRHVANFREKPCLTNFPDELLLKIFNYMGPGDLLVLSSICHRWRNLTNDNIIWKEVFDRYVRKYKKKCVSRPLDPEPGYWKQQCIKGGVLDRDNLLTKYLKKISPYSKLPADVNNALQNLGISWQLNFVDSNGCQHYLKCKDVFYFATSITIRWYDLELPPIGRIRKMRIHSLNPVFVDKSGQSLPNSPCQRSLMMDKNFNVSDLKSDESWVLTKDEGPIDIYNLNNGLIIATWKDGGEIAFVTLSLHANKLLQRCLNGTSFKCYEVVPRRPQPQDLDLNNGFYGYSCIVELRNQRTILWNDQFLSLDNKNVSDDCVCLSAIDPKDKVYHQVLSRKLNFPWKTDIFKGILQNVCILDLTVIDEHQKPMWCISSPVTVQPMKTDTDFEFDGEKSEICYEDSKGCVNVVIHSDKTSACDSIISLQIYIDIATINSWFGTNYKVRNKTVKRGRDART